MQAGDNRPTPLHAEVASVAQEYREAFAIDADPRIEPLRRRLGELAAQLPRTPTVANVAAWAEIALAYAWEARDGDGEPAEHPFCETSDDQDTACANLIAAARGLAGAPVARLRADGTADVGIAALAEEVAAAHAARDAFDRDRVAIGQQQKQGDHDGTLARRYTEVIECEQAADAHSTSLENLLLRFDPQTPTEVLSLALAYGSELDTFLANAVHEQPELEPDAKVLERVHDAIIRGLVFRLGLRSPILDAYVVHDWHDREQPHLAEVREEARLLLASAEADDVRCASRRSVWRMRTI